MRRKKSNSVLSKSLWIGATVGIGYMAYAVYRAGVSRQKSISASDYLKLRFPTLTPPPDPSFNSYFMFYLTHPFGKDVCQDNNGNVHACTSSDYGDNT